MCSKQIVKRSFDARVTEWASLYGGPEPRTVSVKNLMARQRFALQLVDARLPRGSKILDVGCGPGETAAMLMQHGYHVWGLDIAESMVRCARERCRADRFQVGDIEAMPFQDGTFDCVVCLGVLEYLDADAVALSEIERVLKPGGRAVVSTPSASSPFYHMDRLVVAAARLHDFARYRMRGKTTTTVRPAVLCRRHHPGGWHRLLRSAGLELEEWLCYGWGWYVTRIGIVVELLSKGAALFRGTLEPLLGRKLLLRAGDSLARSPVFNWLASEQMVRVRVAK